MNISIIWRLIRSTFKDYGEDKAPRLAAALSYYTIFSLAPLLVVIIAITGFVIGSNGAMRSQILGQVQNLVGGQGAQIVDTLITNTSKPRQGIPATLIGIVTMVLGATGVFGQLQDSLNTIWKVAPRKTRTIWNMLRDRAMTFAMVVGLAFLLLVSLVISTALSVISHYFASLLGGATIVTQILNYVVSIAVITFIFGAIFKVLPDVKIRWGDVWVGALVTALLFIAGQFLISLYLGSTAASSAYGAAGSLVIILLWVYYSAQILFIGAEFTRVYANFRGQAILPNENARPVTETERARQGLPGSASERNYLKQAMIPVAGQTAIHPPAGAPAGAAENVGVADGKERVRYTPPNPEIVVPIVGAGVLAGVFTIGRIIRKFIV